MREFNVVVAMVLLAGWLAATPLVARAADGASPVTALAQTFSWQAPTSEQVRASLAAWLEAQAAPADVRAAAEALWQGVAPTPRGDELLERLAQSVAAANLQAGQLVSACQRGHDEASLPGAGWLVDESIDPLVRHNLRLYYARWLVGRCLYEEAAEQLQGLTPEQVVDPASLLFYEAVTAHRLLARERGLAAIDRLAAGQGVPARYQQVAALMREDLSALEDDSLDHIARRMEDIERRLDLGRAGPKTREVEDGVIASLDKLIEEIEKQQQQQQQAGAGGQMQPTMPAPDSRPMAGKGPGEVTPRAVGSQSGWGDLPPKEREEALQQISQQFPEHYRSAIEQYFRRSAAGDEKPNRDNQK